MNFKTQRRMAMRVMKCGTGRVWMSPEHEAEIKQAITKQDIRGLISKGIIRVKQELGVSKGRTREQAGQKKKGLRKGKGSRKGRASARQTPKDVWMARIRNLRELFRDLKAKGMITNETYTSMREKSKGGLFRSRRHALLHLEEHNLIKQNPNNKKSIKK